MMRLLRQHQKLLRLRLIQERVEEESVSLARLRMDHSEATTDRIRSSMMTTYADQLRSLETGNGIDAALRTQTFQALDSALLLSKATLKIRRQEYLDSLRLYAVAKLERLKAGRIAAASELQWKADVAHRDQVVLDDAYLSKRSQSN